MADGSNLKAKVGMDTGDFERGARKVAKAAQSMGKDMTSSLTDVGKAIGVDTGLLGDLAKRVDSATTLFKGMGTAGGNAASSLTKAMAGLGGAIAGLGLTAAILQFKELNREAEQFGKSLQGANMTAAGQAYRETYRATLDDLSGGGSKWAQRINRWKNDLSTMWADFMNQDATPEMMAEAERRGNRAADMASEMVDLQNKMSDSLVTQQKLQGDINAQLLIAKDRSQSKADRDAAQAKAVELTNQKYDEQIALQRAIADNLAKKNSLNDINTTPEDLRQQRQAEAQVLALEAQRTQELTSLTRLDNQISSAKASQASSAKETQQATELTLEAARQLVEAEREKARLTAANEKMMQDARNSLAMERYNETWGPGIAQMPGIPGMPAHALALPAGDLQKSYDTVKMSYIDLTDTIVGGAYSMADAIGMLAADLINGENAWGNFAQAGISIVADMLSTVGKAFITEGIGVEAAQMALKTGNGLGAIAAGGAMVALAAAMRTAMSNASANWSGGGSSVASSAYSGGSSNTPTAYGREMTVHVTGTLTGEGSKLVAVLNNEADRKRVTT